MVLSDVSGYLLRDYRGVELVPDGERMEAIMEKIYKTMKSVGAFNVVMGILMIVSGICVGVTVIVKGAKLLKHKSDLIF